jgi:hypothetical protein
VSRPLRCLLVDDVEVDEEVEALGMLADHARPLAPVFKAG